MDVLVIGNLTAEDSRILAGTKDQGLIVAATATTAAEVLEQIPPPTVDLALVEPTIVVDEAGYAELRVLSHKLRIPLVCVISRQDRAETKQIAADRCDTVVLSPLDAEQLRFAANAAIRNFRGNGLHFEDERLMATLNSVADAVISTDGHGLVTYVNGAAERLVGRRVKDVLDEPLAHVFRILNSETRVGARLSPAQCARGGTPVNLGDHLLKTADGRLIPIDGNASALRTREGKVDGLVLVFRDISDRKRQEEELRRRNQELTLLNQAGQAFNSSIDLDKVITVVLEEMRRVLGIVACSAWLVDDDNRELVCRAVTGPRSDVVLNWRLAAGQGIAGWVAEAGQSLIVPDTHLDDRHFGGVDRETGLEVRSVLSVPLAVKDRVIGVIQAIDTEVNRFNQDDQLLVESMAAWAAIAIQNAQLAELNRRLAVKGERRRLARELHDTVTQSLYSICLAAEASLKTLRDNDVDPAWLAPLEHIQKTSMDSLIEMREQLHEMRASVMGGKGLLEAVAQHCDLLRAQYGLSIFIVSGAEPQLSDRQRNDLFFIAKEALWNVVKHAGASRVDVILNSDSTSLTLSIADNGVGIDTQQTATVDTGGLGNMEERARLLGGSFRLGPRPGGGTQVTVVVPIEPAKTERST